MVPTNDLPVTWTARAIVLAEAFRHIAFGILLLIVPGLFESVGAYEVAISVMPLHLWAGLFLLSGLTCLYAGYRGQVGAVRIGFTVSAAMTAAWVITFIMQVLLIESYASLRVMPTNLAWLAVDLIMIVSVLQKRKSSV